MPDTHFYRPHHFYQYDSYDRTLVAVTEDDDGMIEPQSLREKIRASGLTFEAIAADAVRYA